MRLLVISLIALTFGFVGSMPLAGPIAVMALARATRGHFGEALRIGLGAAVAEGLYAGVALWGFATFLARYALVVPISRGATAVILAGLGIRFMFWRAEPKTEDKSESKAGTLLLGFTVSALNPTLLLTWMTAVAFLYSKGLEPQSALSAIPFGVCAAAGVGGWFACLTALLRKYRKAFPQKAMTYVIRAMGLALIILGIWAGTELAAWIRTHNERAARPARSLFFVPCPPRPSQRDAPPFLWSSIVGTTSESRWPSREPRLLFGLRRQT